MESVAPPGGVMLSASSARLVDCMAALGDAELVRIKGSDKPVAAERLLGLEERHRLIEPVESNLVGRRWEMSAVQGLLDRAIDGHGAVMGVVGPPGIGKSRLVRELSAMASARGVEVFTTFCESHTSQIPSTPSLGSCGWRSELGASTRGSPAMDCATGSLTQTRRTCCYLMTCWASPIPMWSCRRSIRMLVGGG